MNSSTIFKTENGACFLYDVNHKELLNIHPVIETIHELENNVSEGFPVFYFALYEFYTGYPNEKVSIPEISELKDEVKGEAFLELAAEAGYPPAVEKKALSEDWEDSDGIAEALYKAYPNLPPVALDDKRIIELVLEQGLAKSPKPPDSIYVAAIQRAWILLSHGTNEDELRRRRNSLPPEGRI